MKRSVSVSRVVSHPSTLAVFSGFLGALSGFLLNLASGGKTPQLLWTALVFAIMFSLSLTAWQVYRQEQTGKQWMTMLQKMVFQTYFLTLLADKPEISQLAQQRLGQVLKPLNGEQQVGMRSFSVTTACRRRLSAMLCEEASAWSRQTSGRLNYLRSS